MPFVALFHKKILTGVKRNFSFEPYETAKEEDWHKAFLHNAWHLDKPGLSAYLETIHCSSWIWK